MSTYNIKSQITIDYLLSSFVRKYNLCLNYRFTDSARNAVSRLSDPIDHVFGKLQQKQYITIQKPNFCRLPDANNPNDELT